MSYKNLEIWKLARELVIQLHEMSIRLPKPEQYEEAQQIRRSSKTVKSTIVEGYGRRKYKADFIKFLIYALSSNDETIDHLETLFETGSLTDEFLYNDLHSKLEHLGKKINNFIQAVRTRSQRVSKLAGEISSDQASNIEYLVSSIQYQVLT